MIKKYAIYMLTIILIFSTVAFRLNYIVSADMGEKPSITITLKNMNTTEYLIDLLVYDESGNNYKSTMDYNGDGLTEEQIKTLYDINYNGWISESTRWSSYLLFPDCLGNASYKHSFSYFGTPEVYKIVIVYKSGEIRVSDTIYRTDFTSYVTLDVNTMKMAFSNNVLINLKNIIVPLVITIVAEVIIALMMKIRNIKTIILTNMITNIVLQLVVLFMPLPYLATFIITEILVFIVEYLIYRKYFLEISKNKIIGYTLLANFVTALLTFVI